jgi:integrase
VARLRAIKNLQKGDARVRENPKVEPVADEVIDATLQHLRPNIRAVVQILRHTGARVGEICQLRPMDLDTTKDVWTFTPASHKTKAHSLRLIPIGPKAREIIAPLIEGLAPTDYVFTGVRKKTRPLTAADVGQNVKKAARKAKVKRWHPHQIRHLRLTKERSEGGLDSAQLLAGHTSGRMTERYAAPDVEKLLDAARKRG